MHGCYMVSSVPAAGQIIKGKVNIGPTRSSARRIKVAAPYSGDSQVCGPFGEPFSIEFKIMIYADTTNPLCTIFYGQGSVGLLNFGWGVEGQL